MVANMIIETIMIYDDTNALGNQYIAVEEGNNGNEDSIASGAFRVQKDTYRTQARGFAPTPDDSFYLSISAATTPTINHANGREMCNNIEPGSDWYWNGIQKVRHLESYAPEFLVFTFK